jgi:hypothetical protein
VEGVVKQWINLRLKRTGDEGIGADIESEISRRMNPQATSQVT